jgi:hypothetical protein
MPLMQQHVGTLDTISYRTHHRSACTFTQIARAYSMGERQLAVSGKQGRTRAVQVFATRTGSPKIQVFASSGFRLRRPFPPTSFTLGLNQAQAGQGSGGIALPG